MLLLFTNLAQASPDVMVDASVAEMSKKYPFYATDLQVQSPPPLALSKKLKLYQKVGYDVRTDVRGHERNVIRPGMEVGGAWEALQAEVKRIPPPPVAQEPPLSCQTVAAGKNAGSGCAVPLRY